jgi:hypothetical protein
MHAPAVTLCLIIAACACFALAVNLIALGQLLWALVPLIAVIWHN